MSEEHAIVGGFVLVALVVVGSLFYFGHWVWALVVLVGSAAIAGQPETRDWDSM